MPCKTSRLFTHNGKPNLFLNLKQSYPTRVVEALTVTERGICLCPPKKPAESILDPEMCERWLVPRSILWGNLTNINLLLPSRKWLCCQGWSASSTWWWSLWQLPLWHFLIHSLLVGLLHERQIRSVRNEFECVCWIYDSLDELRLEHFSRWTFALEWPAYYLDLFGTFMDFMAKSNITHGDLELRRMSQGKSRLQTVRKGGLQMVVWRQAKRSKRRLWKGQVKDLQYWHENLAGLNRFWQALEVFWILLPWSSQGLGSSGPTAVKMDRCLASAQSLNCHQHCSQPWRLTTSGFKKLNIWKSDSTVEKSRLDIKGADCAVSWDIMKDRRRHLIEMTVIISPHSAIAALQWYKVSLLLGEWNHQATDKVFGEPCAGSLHETAWPVPWSFAVCQSRSRILSQIVIDCLSSFLPIRDGIQCELTRIFFSGLVQVW